MSPCYSNKTDSHPLVSLSVVSDPRCERRMARTRSKVNGLPSLPPKQCESNEFSSPFPIRSNVSNSTNTVQTFRFRFLRHVVISISSLKLFSTTAFETAATILPFKLIRCNILMSFRWAQVAIFFHFREQRTRGIIRLECFFFKSIVGGSRRRKLVKLGRGKEVGRTYVDNSIKMRKQFHGFIANCSRHCSASCRGGSA